MPLPYQHVIWDWNGTLMDDTWLCIEVINSILQSRNLPIIDYEKYRQNFTFPVLNYYTTLGFDLERDSFEVISKEFIAHYNTRRLECQLHSEANTVLADIETLGIGQSILSAYAQSTLNEIVAHYQIDHHFTALVGLDNIYAGGKISQGLAHLKTLQPTPDQILMIGDTVHDYEVAQSMGTDCILIEHGHNDRQRLQTCNVPIFSNFEGVRGFLTEAKV